MYLNVDGVDMWVVVVESMVWNSSRPNVQTMEWSKGPPWTINHQPSQLSNVQPRHTWS